ncbi:MAG: PQQ-binding-like beta-propeller repeat protein [Bauldia sp.]|nr:PQQ-binding-like beta-propeller repeat protein [Bauldia sp.]
MTIARNLATAGLVGGLLSSVAIPASAESAVTFDRLANPEPENVLTAYVNYQGWRYSTLDQINKDTIGDLRLVFAAPLAMQGGLGGNLQSAALVDDGFIYTVDMTGSLVKLDAGSGVTATQLWRVETTPPESQGRIQGPALWGDNVYSATRIGTVIAVARESGEVLWEETYVQPGEFFDASPIAIENSIIVGQAAGDAGTRGYVFAVDPNDGTEQWRTYMVPGPGEPGHETWPADNDSWMTGCGGIWVAPTYDPETNLIFAGTSNPCPAWDGEFRAGDNLYTASTVVLNGDTGEIEWFHQYTPNDAHEKDEVSTHILFDVEFGGEPREAFGHFSRTGYYFTFDRNSGEFLSAVPAQGLITWTAGIDPKTGKPVEYNPDVDFQRYLANPEREEADAREFCGGTAFITGIWQPAYDPVRQLVYNAGADTTCVAVVVDFDLNLTVEERFGVFNLGGRNLPGGRQTDWRINATDATTGEIVMATDLPVESQTSVLATAGGLVFLGDSLGNFHAYDSDTLDLVWSISLGGLLRSPPFTYAVDGKQYLAIQTGGAPFGGLGGAAAGPNSSNLFVFAL